METAAKVQLQKLKQRSGKGQRHRQKEQGIAVAARCQLNLPVFKSSTCVNLVSKARQSMFYWKHLD